MRAGVYLELYGPPGGELLVVRFIRLFPHPAHRLNRLDVATIAFDFPRRLFERQNVWDDALGEPIGD